MTNNTDDMTYEELYGTKILYGGGDFSWENSQHRDYFSPFSLYRWPNMSGEPGSGRKIVEIELSVTVTVLITCVPGIGPELLERFAA